MRRIQAYLVSGALLIAGRPAGAATLITADGSSTVYPITEAVAEEFQKQHRDARVTVGISGTGGGFKKFCAGETDLCNASRPIKPSEVELCGKNGISYIELPVAFDGLAVVVHLSNAWASAITVTELKRLWEPSAQGVATRWSRLRPGWPDREIRLFGPGVDSGTYDYFTEAVVGKQGASRGDYTASEDDNVLVQGVATDPLALGYFGVAYYEANTERLKLVAVDDENPANGQGPILPTYEHVANGTYQPLARPIFIYVNRKAADRPEIQAFVTFYLNEGRALVKEVGYIGLPDRAYELAMGRFEQRRSGTVFGGAGATVGVKIETLLSH
jgi:phosphate transport system substrate-binding protein